MNRSSIYAMGHVSRTNFPGDPDRFLGFVDLKCGLCDADIWSLQIENDEFGDPEMQAFVLEVIEAVEEGRATQYFDRTQCPSSVCRCFHRPLPMAPSDSDDLQEVAA